MSHNVEKMMFTGKKPWWYGNEFQKDAVGVDLGENAVTSEVALKAAGLDWLAQKRRAGFSTSVDIDGKQVFKEAPKECFLVRSTDHSILGRCTDAYQEFQNVEAFEFLDSLVEDGQLLYHTAGSLEGGKRVWILAQTPTSWTIKRRSGATNTHHAFLNAMLGHDGKHGLHLMATDVRVECANTLGWADERAQEENLTFRIHHRGDIQSKLALAAKALEVMESQSLDRRAMLQSFAQRSMDTGEFIEFATSIFLGLDGSAEEVKPLLDKFYADSTDRQKTQMENRVAVVAHNFIAGQGNEGDTDYDALQAFTEYFDHFDIDAQKSKIDKGIRAAKAVHSSWVGAGAKQKKLVYKRLRERASA